MAVANPLEFPGYEQQLVEAEVAIVPVALAPFVLSLLVGSDGMNR